MFRYSACAASFCAPAPQGGASQAAARIQARRHGAPVRAPQASPALVRNASTLAATNASAATTYCESGSRLRADCKASMTFSSQTTGGLCLHSAAQARSFVLEGNKGFCEKCTFFLLRHPKTQDPKFIPQ